MSKLNQLNSYIAHLQARLRLQASMRGSAVLAGVALLVTLAAVLLLDRYAFPARGVVEARLVLAFAACSRGRPRAGLPA